MPLDQGPPATAPDRKVYRDRDTAAVHGGAQHRMGLNRPLVTPIFQTAAYELPSADVAAGIFDLQVDGHAYTRLNNPTCDVLEERMSDLDSAAAGLAVSSGMAAITLALLNLCQAGDNLVSSRELYGGTWNLLANTFARLGVEARFVDPADPAGFAAATDDRTRCYFGETLPNPRLSPLPISRIAQVAHEHGVPLVVDNTMLPYVCRPMAHGADVVVYSATKYIGGHGSTLGGLILDADSFDWSAHAQRHPLLTQPDASHGNVIWTSAGQHLGGPLGRSPYLLKARETLLRDFGCCLSPHSAFLLLQGLETLPLRMARHCGNAEQVARVLAGHPRVASVRYPTLSTGTDSALAQRYLGGLGGPLVQFEIKGGRAAGRTFVERLRLFSHATNIGDVRSMAIHPASTTHAQLPPQVQLAAGVTQGSIRLSVGIEHPDDLLADLDQALECG